MLSDDDFNSAEINEMKKENPQFEEYDRVFRKIKEAMKMEIQSTKKQLFEKLQDLNTKTQDRFNQLYNSCDKHVRKMYDIKYKSKEVNQNPNEIANDDGNNAFTNDIEINNIKTNKASKKRNQKTNEKESHYNIQVHQQIQDNQTNNNGNESGSSSQEYSDDVIFGFLEGSEEESEFLE